MLLLQFSPSTFFLKSNRLVFVDRPTEGAEAQGVAEVVVTEQNQHEHPDKPVGAVLGPDGAILRIDSPNPDVEVGPEETSSPAQVRGRISRSLGRPETSTFTPLVRKWLENED